MAALLAEHGSLYACAAGAEDARILQGRRPVYAVTWPLGMRVVRRYHRGGAVASLLGDRHLRLGEPRPWREARASDAARDRGVPTPRVVAGAVYRAGPFYRADLVTEYVAGSTDLAGVLFSDAVPPGLTRVQALESTGKLLAHMGAVGVRHVDVNAKNVLLTPGNAMPEAVLLDLDRCRVTVPARRVDARSMLARLERSLERFEVRTGRCLSVEEWEALRGSLARDAGTASHP
ncbi:MAG TPA: lipopolysaccharide kinase InaA family protein [Longimicrobiales bacterium]